MLRKNWPWWVAGGLSFTLLLGIVFFAPFKRGRPLTRERLREARRRWREKDLKDYDLEIRVGGSQRAFHRIQVRGGKVVRMTTGGADVGSRPGRYWTVEGLFGFLETELEHAGKPERAYGVKDPSQVVLRAEFDPEWGFPRRFLRHVMGRSLEARWEVISFSPR